MAAIPIKTFLLFLTPWVLTLGLTVSCGAQTGASSGLSGPPDVVVIVYQRPGLGDQVGITYAHTVPRAQAQRDLGALASAAGWTPSQIKIADAAAPVAGKMGKMTGVSCVAPDVVHDETHAFPLEAFIRAFRTYKRLVLVFFVSSDFQFQGLRQFADNKVQIAMEQHGSAYTYRVAVLDPQFERLDLSPAQGAAPEAAKRRSPLILFLGLFAAAGVAGIVVYMVMARLTPPPDTAEALPEEKSEIGTHRNRHS